jgi:hypothetical protein
MVENEFKFFSLLQNRATFWKQTKQAMYVWSDIGALSRYYCCSVRTINITYYGCVSVAFGILHANRTRRVILPSVACLILPYCSTLSHTRDDFRRKVTENETCFDYHYNFFLNISYFKSQTCRFCQILMEPKCCRQMINKGPTNTSKYQCISTLVHCYMFRRFKAPSSGSSVWACWIVVN